MGVDEIVGSKVKYDGSQGYQTKKATDSNERVARCGGKARAPSHRVSSIVMVRGGSVG
jgi:hypothetical protein